MAGDSDKTAASTQLQRLVRRQKTPDGVVLSRFIEIGLIEWLRH
jgi:hypothetical protein